MDYIKPIYEFRDKIFHVHFKDVHIKREQLNECARMTYPLEYMDPKLPGLGDIDWAAFCSALYGIHYQGYACIEVEDRKFEDSLEQYKIRNRTRVSVYAVICVTRRIFNETWNFDKCCVQSFVGRGTGSFLKVWELKWWKSVVEERQGFIIVIQTGFWKMKKRWKHSGRSQRSLVWESVRFPVTEILYIQ